MMKKLLIAVMLMACSQKQPETVTCPPAATAVPAAPTTKIDVHFSPKDGCTPAIVNFIKSAQKTIHVMAYGFTSKPISEALIEAKKRGVSVNVILDKSNLNEIHSQMDEVVTLGVDVFVDSKHAIMHNKVMLVDGMFVQTGSFNYTAAAEDKNAENCIFIQDASINQKYMANWQLHREHSGLAPTY